MKKTLLLISLSMVFAGAVYAQTPAPAASPQAAPAKVNVICKDGSSFSGDTTKGACSGHGGIDKKATKAGAAATPAPAAATPAASSKAPVAVQAPGGGAGKVWVNSSSKVYHCFGDKYYGKTKQGEYMAEADAKAKGFHASHGKACSK